jgi:hypothetical protein
MDSLKKRRNWSKETKTEYKYQKRNNRNLIVEGFPRESGLTKAQREGRVNQGHKWKGAARSDPRHRWSDDEQ